MAGFLPLPPNHFRILRRPSRIQLAASLLFFLAADFVPAQCVDPASACAASIQGVPVSRLIDEQRPYTLDELIDLAEANHPHTRAAWERALQAADRVGIARSAYLPEFSLLAVFSDQRMINPFPKPLAPRGYTMAEIPTIAPMLALDYALFDSGQRHARLEQSKAEQLAAKASLERAHQDVAFDVIRAYYSLLTAQQRLDAANRVLATAHTTQQAIESQLENGRATLPDVLNARAATAQAEFNQAAADGLVREARVVLRESLGVEPSDQIRIAAPARTPDALAVTLSIADLVQDAQNKRPDLVRLQEDLKASSAEIRAAKAEQRPSLHLSANLGQTALWPTSDYGQLGNANQTTWNVGVNFHWSVFDAGKRNLETAVAQSRQKEAAAALEEKHDNVTRETWSAYLEFRTAMRKYDSALALRKAAQSSYDANFEAFRYGVKNFIDVTSAEKQLAEAEFTMVEAESSVWLSATRLEYATGHLLHSSVFTGRSTPQSAEKDR